MELDDKSQKAVRELGDAINDAIEKSARVAQAIEDLRELGYEPNLALKLEIGLMELIQQLSEPAKEFELDLTEDDLRELQKMKIKISE